MAKYPSISQTKNGRILIAKSNATGKALVPIKVVTGDGQLTNQNIETMENVINPLLELPFASPGRFVKEGQFQLDFALSNEHLEHGFYAREIGVFAKLDGEDDSTAVMIAYTNGGNFVDYIPAKDTPINSKVFEVTIAVDNAASVVVQRSDAAYITAGEMERHNSDANAHDNRFNKYLPLAGGTVIGNVKFNNASVGFNNGNNTYDTKIRIASNGNFDIGVTEDAANKNATPQLLLHSQNKPKWYKSDSGGKDIAMVEDINNAITAVDNNAALAKAPTLQLVKTLLSGLNIKNATDVINALETNKASGLGIRYDFSNPNAWYICLGKLFGNLIIQGGRRLNIKVYDYLQYQEQFPVSFNKNCFGVLVTLEGRGPVSGASVSYTDKRTITGFTIITDASNAEATSDLFYIALGI